MIKKACGISIAISTAKHETTDPASITIFTATCGDHYPVALLVVDVLNDFDFSDVRGLLKKAPTLAKHITAFKAPLSYS